MVYSWQSDTIPDVAFDILGLPLVLGMKSKRERDSGGKSGCVVARPAETD